MKKKYLQPHVTVIRLDRAEMLTVFSLGESDSPDGGAAKRESEWFEYDDMFEEDEQE